MIQPRKTTLEPVHFASKLGNLLLNDSTAPNHPQPIYTATKVQYVGNQSGKKVLSWRALPERDILDDVNLITFCDNTVAALHESSQDGAFPKEYFINEDFAPGQ